jgi:hypothetical protein
MGRVCGKPPMMANNPIKSHVWFTKPPALAPARSTSAKWIRLVLGLLVAAFMYFLGWHTLAFVAAGLTSLFALASITSRAVEHRIESVFMRFGVLVGHWLTWGLLVPIFYVGFVAVRGYDKLSGLDPLRLKLDAQAPSYWVTADEDHRRRRWSGSTFVTERPSTRRRRLVPALVIFAILFCGGEVLLRCLGYGQPVLYVDHVSIGYMPAPSQSVIRHGNLIQINQWGMRSPTITASKPPKTFRILIVGDSTLYGGSYIDQTELYSRLLEKGLNVNLADKRIQVVAMGVNGWGPFHELGYLQHYGHFESDLVIVALPYGDVRRPLSRLSGTPYMPAASPSTLAYEEVIYHLLWRWRQGKQGRPTREEFKTRIDAGIDAYVQLVKDLKQNGAEVMVEILPSKSAALSKTVGDREQKMVDRLQQAMPGTHLGYPAAIFADVGSGLALYRDSVHLDRDGHRLYAEYLRERLAQTSRRLQRFGRDTP